MKKYIVVAGNIGAGKSTLVDKLSARLNWKPYYEPVGENPYLTDFYADMERWAFHSQLYFLSDRLSMQKSLLDFPGSVVQDRSVYEDAEIFARNLFLQGHMPRRDFDTYWKLYRLLVDLLDPPNLIIYLKAGINTLQERIARRGRNFEADIPREYLENLNSLYADWIGSWTICPVLTLDMDELNFQDREEDFAMVSRKVDEALKGLQGELFT